MNKKQGFPLPSSSSPLGHPLPLDEHACSVSLPTWSSVVGYEEGCSQVTDKLACGYPRFVYHPYIVKLMKVALAVDFQERCSSITQNASSENYISEISSENEWDCLVLPTKESALRCHDFIVKACGYNDDRKNGDRIPLFYNDNALCTPNYSSSSNNNNSSSNVYNPNLLIRVLDLKSGYGVHAVVYPAQTKYAIQAKCYWQHTGEVLSSRRAEVALMQLYQYQHGGGGDDDDSIICSSSIDRVTSSFYNQDDCKDINRGEQWKICPITNKPILALYDEECYDIDENVSSASSQHSHSSNTNNHKNRLNSYEEIKKRIASIVGTPSSHVFLTPSGMASIYAALRSSRRRFMNYNNTNNSGGGGTSIVFGFPYLDTLKMCSRPELVPDGVEFYGHGNDQDLLNLEKLLKERRDAGDGAGISVLITEFPSNPLLNVPNLAKIRSLADEYDFAVVVDDTIGNFANVDLIRSGLADAVCTSLTKLFNGRGDAMAGSIVTNPNTEKGQWIQKDLEQNHSNHEGLFVGDAYAVNENSVDFLSRSAQINKTAEALADWLKERDEVKMVYYPKFTSPEAYNSVRNELTYGGEHEAGYGGLLSILLEPHVCQRTFYDKLDLSKGPSLGTDFTLVCPYTLLAHYHELDFAISYDVKPNLLRFAIGLEDLDILKERFTAAFQESKLHPKLPEGRFASNGISSRGFCTHALINNFRYTTSSRFHGTTFHSFGTAAPIKSSYSAYSISTSGTITTGNVTNDVRVFAGKILKKNAFTIRRVVSLIK